jgi:hypothetical protein
MRALALLTLVTGCTLGATSRESGDGSPAGLIIDDAGVDVTAPMHLTHHNDNLRSGANLRETLLSPGNVNAARFGKLFSRSVDGYIYAQPLVVDLDDHNVVYVATEHNSVYAFEADDPAAAAPLWHVHLGTPVSTSEYTCLDLNPEDGITSTPVIDPNSRTLYVSAKHKENGVYAQTLHALDLATGAEKLGGPVDFGGSVPGRGWGSDDGVNVNFNARYAFQRPALLLANGQVYAAFGGHCDRGNYHGWVMAYDAHSLKQTAIWSSTPDDGQGSLWMSGNGPAADDQGNLYFITSNSDASMLSERHLTESFVKLTPTLGLTDWFKPYNYQYLDMLDLELGSSGALLVPDSNLVVGGGKEGVLYVLDRGHLGHFHAGDDSQILQSFKISRANIHGAPIYWQGPSERYLYVMPEESALLQFRFQGNLLDPTPVHQSPKPAPGGMPGGFLTVSADGAKDGIVWATLPLSDNALHATVAGVLRAFDAADVSHELWNSEQNPTRDRVGSFAKFNPPTVVNGKVYLGTFSNQLVVYGLLP